MKHYEALITSLAQKKYAPVYLLDGEEPYYIDALLHHFEEKVVPPEEQDFNLIVLYGKETTWQEVVNAARRFPMFSDRLVVILKDAVHLKDLNALTAYIEKPSPASILVIEHRFKKVDARGKLSKLVEKNGVYFTSGKLKEEQVPEWIIQYGRMRDVAIGQREAELLSACLGNDLQKIANEVEKILINESGTGVVSLENIEKYVGISREYNVLDLPEAVFERNQVKLAGMLNYFTANPKSAPMASVIGIFCGYLQKLYLCYHTKPHFQEDRKLGIWSHHRKLAERYAPGHIHKSIALLESYSHKAVGIQSADKADLLREMIGKMNLLLSR